MSKINELKQWLKTNAEEIKQLRKETKEAQRKGNGGSLQFKLASRSWEYRHHHIAYSELMGKTRDQIEQPREGNEPIENKIKALKSKYAWTPEEEQAYLERKAAREQKNAQAA